MRFVLIGTACTAAVCALVWMVSPSSTSALQEENTPGSWSISNGKLEIELSAKSRGGISSLMDAKTRRNFISGTHPLYRLVLSRKGQDPVALTSLDARDFRVTRSSSGQQQTLRLTYDRHRTFDIGVICTVSITQDSALSS